MVAAFLLVAFIVALAAPALALERPNHALYEEKDKCMKTLWPDVVDKCSTGVGYHGSCQARVGNFQKKYGGSCETYCSSFGFKCVYGSRVDPSSRGCGETTGTSYVTCTEKVEGDEALCTCVDMADTFLWLGVKKLCGAGKALVENGHNAERAKAQALPPVPGAPPTAVQPTAKTCTEFCGLQGLRCVFAEGAAAENNCTPRKPPIACDAAVPAEGAICKCEGSFDRTGSYKWPDKVEVCSMGTVLVAGDVLSSMGGTCENYCTGLRKRVPGLEHLVYSCYAAFSAQGTGCEAAKSMAFAGIGPASDKVVPQAEDLTDCRTDMKGNDAVCSCSFLDL